jgi:hypothetical protein
VQSATYATGQLHYCSYRLFFIPARLSATPCSWLGSLRPVLLFRSSKPISEMPQTTGKTTLEEIFWLDSAVDWSTNRTADSRTASDSIIAIAHKGKVPPKVRSLNNYMTALGSPKIHVSQPLSLVVLEKELVDGIDASHPCGPRHRPRHSSGLDSIPEQNWTNAWLLESQGYEFGKRNRQDADVGCKLSSPWPRDGHSSGHHAIMNSPKLTGQKTHSPGMIEMSFELEGIGAWAEDAVSSLSPDFSTSP